MQERPKIEQNNRADGIYTGFFTAAAGSSTAVFVFFRGKIDGVDLGNGTYEGSYEITNDGETIEGIINFHLPVGSSSILGISAQVSPIDLAIPIKIPVVINPDSIYRIETPAGPVNAKFAKRRSL